MRENDSYLQKNINYIILLIILLGIIFIPMFVKSAETAKTIGSATFEEVSYNYSKVQYSPGHDDEFEVEKLSKFGSHKFPESNSSRQIYCYERGIEIDQNRRFRE